jgi:hypothetical protein
MSISVKNAATFTGLKIEVYKQYYAHELQAPSHRQLLIEALQLHCSYDRTCVLIEAPRVLLLVEQ